MDKFSTMNLMDKSETVLPAAAKGYAVLFNHVTASYTLTKEYNGRILRVTGPESFHKQKLLMLGKK